MRLSTAIRCPTATCSQTGQSGATAASPIARSAPRARALRPSGSRATSSSLARRAADNRIAAPNVPDPAARASARIWQACVRQKPRPDASLARNPTSLTLSQRMLAMYRRAASPRTAQTGQSVESRRAARWTSPIDVTDSRGPVTPSADLGVVGRVNRQREPDLRASFVPIPCPDATTHRVDQLPADEQPDPGTGRLSGRIRRAREQLEELVRVVLGDADAFVEDPHDDLTVLGPGGHLNRGPGLAVLRGIRQEIAQDLLDVRLLTEHEWEWSVDLEPELASRPARRLGLDGPTEDVGDDHRVARDLDPAALRPREYEQVLDQAIQPIGFGLDILDRLVADVRRQAVEPLAEHLAEPVDCRDRRSELMTDDADERFAERVCAALVRISARELDGPRQRADGRRRQL